MTKPLTLLNGKALGQPDQYKPTNHRAQSRPMVLILTSSASKILQKFMTPPHGSHRNNNNSKSGHKFGWWCSKLSVTGAEGATILFLFLFFFFAVFLYIFLEQPFLGEFSCVFRRLSHLLAVCLFVCLFVWPCVPVLGMFLSCLGHIKSLLKASLRPT